MIGLHPTEGKFEGHIESYLNSIGFKSRHHSEYDRNLCLIRKDVIEFIRETQPDSWRELEERHGIDAENRLLKRISDEIARRGLVEVLRSQIVDLGVYLNLCYFKPRSSLAPEHQELYQKNKFTLIRQLHFRIEMKNRLTWFCF